MSIDCGGFSTLMSDSLVMLRGTAKRDRIMFMDTVPLSRGPVQEGER